MKNSTSKYTIVKKSKIDGHRGVFAKCNIKAGTKIIEYTGKLVTKKEGDEISLIEDMTGKFYLFTLNKKYDIAGNIGGNEAHLFNHSCDPNCESENANGTHIWIYSIRFIKKGEELTFNYGLESSMADHKTHPCKCGSKNCRGLIINKKDFKRYLKSNSDYAKVHKKKLRNKISKNK